MSQAALTIGELARRMGLKASAIRYYEARGLLPAPERVGGQRRYGPETVRRLQVIDVAKRAGFSLDEAGVLLAAGDRGTPAHERLRELAAQKLPQVDALIERATEMRAWLETASGCNCQSLDACLLFDADPAAAAADDGSPITLTVTQVGCRREHAGAPA